jgi:hypothetical protein
MTTKALCGCRAGRQCTTADWHGTTNGYSNRKCRCDRCTAANTESLRHWRDSSRVRPAAEVPHGTAGGYQNWGCRCGQCRIAHAEARRHWYHRTRTATL